MSIRAGLEHYWQSLVYTSVQPLQSHCSSRYESIELDLMKPISKKESSVELRVNIPPHPFFLDWQPEPVLYLNINKI